MKSISLALLFVFSQYTLWLGENGVWGVAALNQQIKLQQQEHAYLSNSIKELRYKVNELKKHPLKSSALLEDHMRWKLGVIKKGEWFCRW